MSKALRGLAIVMVFFVIALASVYLSGTVGRVKAAIAVFAPATCATATATTSLVYQTPGTATSTLTCNLGNEGAQSAIVTTVLNASSTGTQPRFFVEESMDGIDWFQVSPALLASTSATLFLDSKGGLSFNMASSTLGGVAASTGLVGLDGTNNRAQFSFEIPVRMKWVRVVEGLASTTYATPGINGGVWMKIVPRQPIN